MSDHKAGKPVKKAETGRVTPLMSDAHRCAVVVERDSSEFARLSQLGDILGLSPIEINSVHSGLAEQAYRSQVQQACLATWLTCSSHCMSRCCSLGPSKLAECGICCV